MATEIWLVKDENGLLHPSAEADAEYLKRFKAGAHFKASVTMKRNGKHHRLGMALLQAVFDNQDKYLCFEHFLTEVKLLTGYVTTHISSNGDVYYIPKSIAFESMDELAFGKWKNEALSAVMQHFIPDMSPADQENLINYILAH